MVTMASPAAPSRVSSVATSSPSRHDNVREQQSTPSIYSAIMTPINFVVFLVSLLLVDLRYTMIRAYGHPDIGSRLPVWLHQLLYRPRPYQNGRQGTNGREDKSGRWYYHSKQKKLMKMEASEAFQLRSTVLLLLAVSVAFATGGLYYAASRLYYSIRGPA